MDDRTADLLFFFLFFAPEMWYTEWVLTAKCGHIYRNSMLRYYEDTGG